jgi:hypothetical protein
MKADMTPKFSGAASIAAACFVAMLSSAFAAPLKPTPEDRYIAIRDAAIKKLQPMYDANNFDAASKAEAVVVADLLTQMTAVLGEHTYKGFGPAKLNLDTLSKGDEGFGMLDGLRFEAETGRSGEKAGSKDTAGNFVEPKAHIIITTPTLFDAGCTATRIGSTRASRMCRSRSARRSRMAASIPRRYRAAPRW